MNKVVKLVLVALSVTLLGFAEEETTGISDEDFASEFQIISMCDATEDDLNWVMEGSSSEVVIEFPAQTQIPLHFFLRGDLLNFVETQESIGLVEVAQTFYLRSIKNELFLSRDLVQWVSFFDFITGELSISLNCEQGSTFLAFGVEVNKSK